MCVAYAVCISIILVALLFFLAMPLLQYALVLYDKSESNINLEVQCLLLW